MPVGYSPKGAVYLGNILFETTEKNGKLTLMVKELDIDGNIINTWEVQKDTHPATFNIKMVRKGEDYDIYVDNTFICSIHFIEGNAKIYVDSGGNFQGTHNWKWYNIRCE